MEIGITLQKIIHRNKTRIAVFYPYNDNITAILKTIDAKYSKTNRCWYVDYSKKNYTFIINHFKNITFIDKNGLKKNYFINTTRRSIGDRCKS